MNGSWLRLAMSLSAVLVAGFSNQVRAAVILVDRPDVKVRDAATSVEAIGHECTVTVHPDDWRIVLMSVIGPNNHCLEWVSTDGGFTWKGDATNDHSADFGDPAVAILKGSPTRYFVQGITLPDRGQRVVYSDSPTALFNTQAIIYNSKDQGTDKGWLAADNTNSSQSGNMYSLWYRPVNAGLAFRYSLFADRGTVWLPLEPLPPITLRSTGVCWGGVIAIGIADSVLGHVYVAWPNSSALNFAPNSISFKRSSNIPTFTPAGNAGITVTDYPEPGAFAPRVALPGNTDNVGANSIPSMATDDQGNIYIGWCQKRPGVNGGDAHIYVAKSTDEGSTWPISPVEVTTSTANQWLPWIAWDDEAKALVAMFHDSRANSNQAEVYLAVSYDRGATFTELKVSDVPWSGNPSGANDYNGVASVGGVTYPMWCDDRDGVLKVYTSPTLIGGIESTSIVPTITHFCTAGAPRIRFQVDWSTLASMEGLDKLTVTRPGGTQYTATANSTSKTHQLVIADVGCGNGTWTFQVESNKGPHKSQSAVIGVSVSCMTCPPCPPPCELD